MNLHCDLLIRGGLVVTMDPERRVLEAGSIAVKDGRIIAVGPSDAAEMQFQAYESIDAARKMVLPGLINTHTHAAMTVFRGMADDLPLQDWLQKYIWPAEAKFMNADVVHLGTQLAAAEMIRSGTTCFSDMYFCEDRVAGAACAAGMRAVIGEGLLDFPTPCVKTPEEGIEYVAGLIERWKGNPLVRVSVAPHAIYTCSREVLLKAKRLAEKHGVPVHIHLSEPAQEVADSKQKFGATPVGYLESLGLLDERVTAVHCVHLTPDDIGILARRRVKVAHCPESNMKLASGTAPVTELLAAGVEVGLATDGAASNNDLDMIGEMATAARLHKAFRGDPTALSAQTVLEMATIRAARVINRADEIGSLETGKAADLIVIDLDQPHLTPLYNPYSHVAYSLGRGDVETTIINGRVVMRDRKVLTVDEAEVMAEVRALALRIRDFTASRH